MTTPIGSGINARYGYEEEELFCGEESLTCISEDPPMPDNFCRTEAAGGGVPAAPPVVEDKKAQPCDVLPDYTTLAASASLILQATLSVTVDRYGHVYTARGVGVGTPGLGASVMNGYLRDPDDLCEPPTAEVLEDFLVGEARSLGGGAAFGIGVTRSSDRWASEVGVTTPQLGASYTLAERHDDWGKKDGK